MAYFEAKLNSNWKLESFVLDHSDEKYVTPVSTLEQ
jgi:hypothetical protein